MNSLGKNSLSKNGINKIRYGVSAIVLSAAVVGCASNPPPKSELAVSKSAIESALSEGGMQYAPLPLKTAQDKQAQAEKIVADKDDDRYLKAEQLAEQAALDAKLAQVTAQNEKLKKSLQESESDKQAIKQEVNRQ
ncbi:MAG: DUF4398 domain-containing protein [Spongiibacteraceae bacterium]